MELVLLGSRAFPLLQMRQASQPFIGGCLPHCKGIAKRVGAPPLHSMESSMMTCVFTPSHETGILMADIILDAGSHDTRLGRESSWPQVPQDPSFFRPLRVKGAFCALTGRAAFLFCGNVEKAVCIAYTSACCIVRTLSNRGDHDQQRRAVRPDHPPGRDTLAAGGQPQRHHDAH